MTFTFDDLAIPYPRETGRSYTPNLHITIRSMNCTQAEADNMRAKTGTFSENVVAGGLVSTKGTAILDILVYGAETFEDMRIVAGSFKVNKDVLGSHIEYEMTLAQDTTTA